MSNKEILEIIKKSRTIEDVMEYLNGDARRDRNVALEGIKKYGEDYLECISNDLFEDKEFILFLVNENASYYRFARGVIKNDADIFYAALKKNPYAIEDAGDRIKSSENVANYLLRKRPEMLKYFSNEIKNNKEIVLGALREIKNRINERMTEMPENTLEFLGEKLRNDRTMIKEIEEMFGFGMRYAGEDLKGDKGLVLSILDINGNELKYVPNRLREDEEVVMMAIAQSSDSIVYAGEELRSDKRIVGFAIKSFVKQESGKMKYINNSVLKKSAQDIKISGDGLAGIHGMATNIILEYLQGMLKDIIPMEMLNDKTFIEKEIQEALNGTDRKTSRCIAKLIEQTFNLAKNTIPYGSTFNKKIKHFFNKSNVRNKSSVSRNNIDRKKTIDAYKMSNAQLGQGASKNQEQKTNEGLKERE